MQKYVYDAAALQINISSELRRRYKSRYVVVEEVVVVVLGYCVTEIPLYLGQI